jgi:hypothetical protein
VVILSKIVSIALYCTSFLPLWISVLFIDIKNLFTSDTNIMTEIISLICILVMLLLSLVVLFCSFCKGNKAGVSKYTLVSAKEEKIISIEYLLTYILPLVAFDFGKWDGVILFLIFFIILGYLCIKHNFLTLNIVLDFAHYNMYNCTLKNEDNIEIVLSVLSHRKLNGEHGTSIELKSLNNEISLDMNQ